MSGRVPARPAYRTKSEYAVAALREALIEGRYARGERLQAAKLARDLGLSLTPVREALIELASEGLVELAAHRGARVGEVSIGDLADIYAVRAVLESAATALAAPHCSDEVLAALAHVHAQFEAAVRGTAPAVRLRALNDAFHFLIYDAAGSPLLRSYIKDAWCRSPFDTFARLPNRGQRSLDEHDAILSALQRRDARAAEAAMRRHLESSFKLLERHG